MTRAILLTLLVVGCAPQEDTDPPSSSALRDPTLLDCSKQQGPSVKVDDSHAVCDCCSAEGENVCECCDECGCAFVQDACATPAECSLPLFPRSPGEVVTMPQCNPGRAGDVDLVHGAVCTQCGIYSLWLAR